MRPYYRDGLVTLYLADCCDLPHWLEADVLVTDPPYGIGGELCRDGSFDHARMEGNDGPELRDAALALWGERPALVFGSWRVPRPAATRMVLTWEKGEHVAMGDTALPWKPNTDEIYVLGSGFHGPRTSSVLHCLALGGFVGYAANGTRRHPTEKPVGLMRELIAKCPAGATADPFAGVGTTLIAAKQLGRRAVGVEVRADYCEAAARRLSQLTIFEAGAELAEAGGITP